MDSRLQDILGDALQHQASDVHLSAGESVFLRVSGELIQADAFGLLDSAWLARLATELLSEAQQEVFAERGSADGAFTWNEHRFRFNVYQRAGSTCFSMRRLDDRIPALADLGIAESLYDICRLKDGLVLVAGPTGSGKSTTMAALLDRVNQTRAGHIITIEDPVEFLHPSSKSLVNQRQIGSDVPSFHQALLDAMRQDPDVILVGELRDLETIQTAITAAETGHLVLATVHAGDTRTAVERLVSAYSADEQNLAQRLVATVLRSVIVQHLLPAAKHPDETSMSRTRVLATERVHINSALANLIANGNLEQMTSIVQTSGEEGMWTLDESLAGLLRAGKISEQTARSLARQPDLLGQLARARRGGSTN